jgi:leucyl aminopeptidase
MTAPVTPKFIDINLDEIKPFEGKVITFLDSEGKMDNATRRVNSLMKGALARLAATDQFKGMKQGTVLEFPMPHGMSAMSVIVAKLDRRCSFEEARKCGANIAKLTKSSDTLILGGVYTKAAEIAFGAVLMNYDFDDHKSADAKPSGNVTVMVSRREEMTDIYTKHAAQAEGVFFTRDLVNEPANVLTTVEFADRLIELKSVGLEVSVLEEADMEKLGMGSLLGVGQGSPSPSKIVIMKWNGGGDEAPFALVGKGVVFDTGGISLKPAGGMEDMTMDMGGAGVVAGVMKTLALRKAKANVVGLVGLVENMPDGLAQRPGDVVTSMKGDTIEVINTDAEGRLVLADVLWYAQETFKPTGVINLATLTGAIIVGLGHENAGVFSNDDTLCKNFLKAADAECEGAWRMPMGDGYDDLIKSRIADIKNVGGRTAGSITAAQFLKRFIKDDMPWIHLDIAGVASVKSATALAPKGATGWGVRALDRMIADVYEA